MDELLNYIRSDGTIKVYYQTIGGRDPGWHTITMPAEGLDSVELARLAAFGAAEEDRDARKYGGSIGATVLVAVLPEI